MEKKLNAVVGQSGGPTAAINATLAGVISGCLNSSEIGTVYGMRNGIEGFMKESFIELNGYFGDEKDLELLKQMCPHRIEAACTKWTTLTGHVTSNS